MVPPFKMGMSRRAHALRSQRRNPVLRYILPRHRRAAPQRRSGKHGRNRRPKKRGKEMMTLAERWMSCPLSEPPSGVSFLWVLTSMSMRYRDTHLASPTISKGKGLPSRSHQEECFKLLSVSLSHLNPDAEMRRFFGGKVVTASRNEPGSSPRARRQPTVQRSNLTRPRPDWWPAKLREGLTLRPLTDSEAAARASIAPWNHNGEKYWTVEYSKRYKGATLEFMQTVLSGGEPVPNQNDISILSVFPLRSWGFL